jgi:hypothetical protein
MVPRGRHVRRRAPDELLHPPLAGRWRPPRVARSSERWRWRAFDRIRGRASVAQVHPQPATERIHCVATAASRIVSALFVSNAWSNFRPHRAAGAAGNKRQAPCSKRRWPLLPDRSPIGSTTTVISDDLSAARRRLPPSRPKNLQGERQMSSCDDIDRRPQAASFAFCGGVYHGT